MRRWFRCPLATTLACKAAGIGADTFPRRPDPGAASLLLDLRRAQLRGTQRTALVLVDLVELGRERRICAGFILADHAVAIYVELREVDCLRALARRGRRARGIVRRKRCRGG